MTDDAIRTLKIYGPDTLKGKTTKKKSVHVISRKADTILDEILKNHGDITLCADIFYVNGEKFFHTDHLLKDAILYGCTNKNKRKNHITQRNKGHHQRFI